MDNKLSSLTRISQITNVFVFFCQKAQTVHMLKLANMHVSSDSCTFQLISLLKQTRPLLSLVAYEDLRSCSVTILREHIRRTESLRGSESQLQIIYTKPHSSTALELLHYPQPVMHKFR